MPACNEYDETAHINVIYNQNIGSLTTNMILHVPSFYQQQTHTHAFSLGSAGK